jgi:hypothetical protein
MRKVLLVLSVIALATTTAHVAPPMLHRWRRSVATSWARSQRERRISRRPLSSVGLQRLHDGFAKLVAHSSVSRRVSLAPALLTGGQV